MNARQQFRAVRKELFSPSYLETAFDEAEEGSVYVISRYRDSNANLRTQFLRIIRRAGVEPWPRLFQNLRASRETELANEYQLHVVTDWLGNTPTVADRHYLKTTEEHFRSAAQNAAQYPSVNDRNEQESDPDKEVQENEEAPALQGLTSSYDSVHEYGANALVPPRGIEPLFSD